MVNKIGIYAIENTVTGHCYIGSSDNLPFRRTRHFSNLRNGHHANPHLQAAWNRYGEDAFVFTVLMRCSKAELLGWEQTFLDEWKPEYNLNFIAVKPPGIKGKKNPHSDEARRKMSEVMKQSPAARKHMQELHEAQIGTHHSDEHRRKISEANLGKHHSGEPGRKPSDAMRRKMSEAHKGKKRKPFSDDHRRRISEARRGLVVSDETRRKLSDALKGHPVSEETRRKISETQKKSG